MSLFNKQLNLCNALAGDLSRQGVAFASIAMRRPGRGKACTRAIVVTLRDASDVARIPATFRETRVIWEVLNV